MKKMSKRITSVILTISLLLSYIPAFSVLAAEVDDVYSRTADASSFNGWTDLFLPAASHANNVELTTENAGAVWTDKSVFKADEIPEELKDAVSKEGTRLSVTDTGRNFLVSLSAIASNKEIVGYSTIPTDTVIILDLSSSMRSNDDSNGSAINELVEATNKAITQLLDLNRNNRVAVVLYAGNTNASFTSEDGATKVVLPMDSYTAGNQVTYDNKQYGSFLVSTEDGSGRSDWAVQVAENLKNSSGITVEQTKMDTATGTYSQDGIYEAMKVLCSVEDTTVQEGVQAGTTRKPIMVLMTDGEPTLANPDYNGNDARTELGDSVMCDYSRYNHRDTIAFMTQLTAAFAKKQVAAHYETDALFYTMSYGEKVTERAEALSVVDPSRNSAALEGFWSDFLAGKPVTVYQSSNPQLTVENSTVESEKLTADDKIYVDEYFPANTDGEFATAFQAIVDEIILQSKYYPTYVETDYDHDGFITFVDKIGGYMEITKLHGLVVGDAYFSGATLAAGVSGADSSDFGTMESPSEKGQAVLSSIQQRLGITDPSVTKELLQEAIDHGQISFTDATNFSNYIGWYSDENGNYLDFWYEGITSAAPVGATHIMKSYGYLGATDSMYGVNDTDMLFSSVCIATELNDYDGDGINGESLIVLQIPASLIPTLTYQVEVDVDENGNITDMISVSLEHENVKPIRLLYEVALQSDIYDWNLTEKVSEGYAASTANKDSGYVFYTNQWNKQSSADDTSNLSKYDRNTYSHFEPSVQNEWYYYAQNTAVLSDQNGTVYTGNTHPSETQATYYRSFQVYERLGNGTYRMHAHYEQISEESLAKAVFENGEWMIPKGTVHRYMDNRIIDKGEGGNKTGTLSKANYPTVVSSATDYYSYEILGNNGKLSVTPATGIRLTKTVSETVPGASDTFSFVISGGTGKATIVRLDENGYEASRDELTFTADKAEFTMTAGETVYIIDLAAGTTYTISEKENDAYAVRGVMLNGVAQSGKSATFTAVNQTVQTAEFENGPLGYGNLYLIKELASNYNVPASIFDDEFEIIVNVGASLAGKSFDVKQVETVYEGAATVASDGTLQVDLDGQGGEAAHNFMLSIDENWEVLDLPEGTVVTVTENLTTTQEQYFKTVIYKTRDHTSADQEENNQATIFANANATAIVINTYTPVASDPVTVKIDGTKTFDLANYVADSGSLPLSFDFVVEEYSNGAWTAVEGLSGLSVEYDSDDVADNHSVQTFSTTLLDGAVFDKEGTRSFRILEKAGSVNGITYDQNYHYFDVIVTDEDGKLVATVEGHNPSAISNTSDGWSVQPSFDNTYATAEAHIDLQKAVTDAAGLALSKAMNGFEFALYPATVSQGVWQEGSTALATVNADALGNARFSQVYNNTEIGTHYYIAKEVIPNPVPTGWTYDQSFYCITVEVSEDAGVLSAEITDIIKNSVDENGDSVTETYTDPELLFTNVYQPEETEIDLNLIPTVFKTLEGRDLLAEEFSFVVVKDGVDATDKDNWILTGTNDADGKVKFKGMLTLKEAGIFKYDLVELVPEEPLGGVTYDHTIFDMMVSVEDKDGKLEAFYIFEDSTTQSVTFKNSYRAEDHEVVIEGTKILTGRSMLNGEFDFTLTQIVGENDKTAVAGGTKRTTENDPDTDRDGSATFSFPAITYTHDDIGKTFYYLIKEVNAGAKILGVSHSTAEYIVKVAVSDHGDGTLSVEKSLVNGEKIEFTNTYDVQNAVVSVAAFKELENKKLNQGDFSFILQETDSTYAAKAGGYSETAENNANGTVTFTDLTFRNVGDYYYTVAEERGADTHVDYDAAVYRIHIKVTDNGEGALVAVKEMWKAEAVNEEYLPTSTISFMNTYNPGTAEVSLIAEKTIDGQAPAADAFQFELYESDVSGNAIGTALQTKANGTDGSVAFDAISYTMNDVGTYYYLVKEVGGGSVVPVAKEGTGASGILYDDAKYLVKVEVSYDETTGVVSAVSTFTKDGNAVTEMIFANETKTVVEKDVFSASAPSVSIDGKSVSVGEELQYQITYFNDNDTEATVTVTDTLPQGTEYVSGSASDGGVSGNGKITWTFTVPAKSEKSVTFKAKVVAGNAVIRNSADATVAGNTYTTNEVVNYTYEKKVDKNEAVRGDALTYTIDYKNYTDGAVDVQIVDQLDAALKYVEGSASDSEKLSVSGQILTWSFENVQPGTEIHVSFQAKVISDEENTVSNIGKIYINGIDVITNTVPVTVTYTAEGALTLSAEKTLDGAAPAADAFQFELYESDVSGNAIGTALQTKANGADGSVTFDAISYTEKDDGKTFFYLVKEKDGGSFREASDHKSGILYDDAEYLVKVTVTDNGDNTLKIQREITEVGGAAVSAMTFENETHTIFKKDVFEVNEPTLSIDGRSVSVGEELQYQITYYNGHDTEATVTVTDTIPQGTEYVSGSASKDGAYADGKITWTLTVPAKSEVTVTFRVKVEKAGADIKNRANATEAGNTYTTNEVVNYTYEKKVDKTEASIGDTLQYNVVYQNNEQTAMNVQIVDTLSPMVAYVEGSASKGGVYDAESHTITWTFNAVEPGEEFSAGFHVTVIRGTSAVENIIAVIENGRTVKTNQVETRVLLPKLSVVKTQAFENGNPTAETLKTDRGVNVVYTFTVTNSGDGIARNVLVSDTVPAGLIPAANANVTNGVFTAVIDSLAPGESKSVSFTVTVPSVTTETVWKNIATVIYDENGDEKDETIPSNEVVLVQTPPAPVSTGDASNLLLWYAAMFVSGMTMFGSITLLCKKKKEREN